MASLLDPRMVATPENTYAPTKRDVGNLGGGLLSGLLGYPGDIQELARLGGNTAIGLLSKVNPVARQLGGLGGLLQARSGPTSEEVGASLGADPNTGAFMAGTIGAPDPNDIGRGLLGMTLFHGTPHRFDKFDISKIGTGEGAQAFGHGLYFAENPKVAGEYAASVTGDNPAPRRLFKGMELEPGTPQYHAGTLLEGNTTLAQARKEVAGWIEDAKNWPPERLAEKGEQQMLQGWKETLRTLNEAKSKADFSVKQGGHLYEVDIPDEVIEKFLDWDAPLSEQPESVQKIADSYGVARTADGGTLVEAMQRDIGKVGASQTLAEAGIPGIRFWDGDSRRFANVSEKTHEIAREAGSNRWAFFDKKSGYMDTDLPMFRSEDEALGWLRQEKGTRNIVVFDPDSTINSVKRDGEEVFRKGLLDAGSN